MKQFDVRNHPDSFTFGRRRNGIKPGDKFCQRDIYLKSCGTACL